MRTLPLSPPKGGSKSLKMTQHLQQRRFRRISASAVRVRASKKVQLSRIGSRTHAFQRAIETVETLSADIGRSRRFSKGVGHFRRKFRVEGDIAHQPLLASEN